jgi:nitroreductase
VVLDIASDELLTMTRTVRRRFDLHRAVDPRVVEECLKIAFQAPNGSNEQDVGWVIVEDAATRRELARLYREGLDELMARPQSNRGPDHDPRDHEKMVRSFMSLVDNLADVPIHVVPAIGPRYGSTTTFEQASRWGSILPAVWSLMLALRSRGLGAAWTTLHLFREEEAAKLLSIPYPTYSQAGLFPVGHTIGETFRRADRRRCEERVFWNRWGHRRPAGTREKP